MQDESAINSVRPVISITWGSKVTMSCKALTNPRSISFKPSPELIWAVAQGQATAR
jgi:hypothetical protein